MEHVLDLYERPYDPMQPVVCFDERPPQLVSETHTRLPMAPGRPQRYDYEYKREGTCNLFALFQPLAQWRHIKVTDQRTAEDFALCMQYLVDVLFPFVHLIHVVLDNLNTHTSAALSQTFEAAQARRLLDKLQFHYTPKHGSWLNMVELELSVLSRQCLARRIPTTEELSEEVGAWEASRNQASSTINWRFTNSQARVKLERLYPQPTLSES